MAQRKAITLAQARRWVKATKAEKSEILDVVCATTGWSRDHARKQLRLAALGQMPGPRKKRVPVLTYGPEVIAALVQCWVLLDGVTGKRLQPALPGMVEALEHHGELHLDDGLRQQLLAMSAATIDRRLAPYRQGLIAVKGRSLTKPGSLLKSTIPMKTWAEWDDTAPGFIEIDLVGHDGGDNNGAFHFTLNATDVATGWCETITVRSKGERVVSAGLEELIGRFPFLILGIHSDNGSEFINHHLKKWCETRQLTFTRGRANHSNDQAHIEQKNWSVVRHFAGYWRYDTPRELALLNQLWPLVNQLTNLFIPSQKLVSKKRTGARVTKRHDTAATPAARLTRDHPDTLTENEDTALRLRRRAANPAQLNRDISLIHANLFELPKRRGRIQRRAKINATYLNRTKMDTIKRASLDESTNQTIRAY